MNILIIVLIVWAPCSVLTYGLYFAHFQRKFPNLAEDDYQKDRRNARIAALFGPIGLLVELLTYEGFGMKFK